MTLDDINELVEEIQQILASEAPALEEELMDLAARLEETVRTVTRRLRQVDELLSKGLRSEAIELAEREPNLNDVITALDFPEFDAWNELLAQFDISAVKALPADLAADLNDAYALSAGVENLLQRFRSQSLARAPLTSRIDTLRRLASQDADNPTWSKDLGDFERARLAEMKSQLEAALQKDDLEQLASLDRELASRDWRIAVPAALKKQAAEAHRSARRSSSRRELETLAHKLSDAYADFDVTTARQLRQRFDALRQIVNLPSGDPLLDVAGPALEWIEQEDRRQAAESEHAAAVQQLEAALEGNATLQDLERLFHQAVRHDHGLPATLESRLADRLETLRTQTARRRTGIVIGSVVGGLAVVVAVVLFVREIGIRGEIQRHELEIAELLDAAESSGVLEPVTDYFKRVDAGRAAVSGAPELQGLRRRLEALQISEAGRLAQIADLLSAAGTMAHAATRLEQVAQASESLQKARQLARNPGEESQIVAAELRVREKQNALQYEIDRAFGTDLDAVTQQIAALPSDRVDGYSEVLARLAELYDRAGVSTELKTSVEALQVKVTQQQSMISRNLEIARDMNGITQAVGKTTEYETRLRDAAQKYVGTQRAKDFERVLNEEQAYYRGALAWNEIRQKLQTADPRTIRTPEAQLLVDEVNVFLQTSGPYPGPMLADTRLAVLRSIAARQTGADGTMNEAIREIFAARTISSAYLVKTTENELYYTPDIPEAAGNIYRFDYFTTTTGTQTTSRTLGRQKIPLGDQPSEDDWLAPQTRLWRLIMRELNSDAPDFEQDLVRIIGQVMSAADVDPILRFLLLEKLLKLGSDNSEFFRKRAERPLKFVEEAGVSRLTNWVVFEDKRAEKDRSNADFFFKSRQAEILEALRQIAADRAELEKTQLGPRVQWLGWLHKDADGNWGVSCPAAVSSNLGKQMFVVGPKGPQQPVELLSAGTLPDRDTSRILVDQIDPTWPEGRPVFRLVETP